MKVSLCRRSRIYANETFSAFRLFRSLPYPVHCRVSIVKGFCMRFECMHHTMSPLQGSCGGCRLSPLEARIQPIQVWPLPLSRLLARRTYSTSHYFPSCLAVLLTCYFPLWVFPLGRSVVLVGIHPQPSAPIRLSHLRRSGAPNPVCLFNHQPQSMGLRWHPTVPIYLPVT
jgi:hypothetical protein